MLVNMTAQHQWSAGKGHSICAKSTYVEEPVEEPVKELVHTYAMVIREICVRVVARKLASGHMLL